MSITGSLSKPETSYKVICLTGGPCGGKTSSVSVLTELFEALGWKVYRPPETATLLFGGGIHFPELNAEMSYILQKSLLSVMLQIENTYRSLAELNCKRGIKTVIICDRGAMDPSAYMERHGPNGWLQMLNELKLDEVALRDHRYDCIVHLVSAAKGAEQFYQTENNATRTEGIELARELDTAVMNAWIGHQSLQVITNDSVNFTQKLDHVIQTICTRIGLTEDSERFGKAVKKRKFLVMNYQLKNSPLPVESREFLVERNDGSQIRIRKRNEFGTTSMHFTMTVRHPQVDGQRVEIRRQITPREYDSYKSQIDPNRLPVTKLRRCFLYADRYFQLDVFESPREGLVLLEGYLDVSESLIPDFLECIDVTDDPNYSMFNICKAELDLLRSDNRASQAE